MILRGINFGPVLQASGVTNFHGRGYWYHWPFCFIGLDFRGSTKVTKTTTFLGRPGNMPLKKDGVTPKKWFPRCIIVNLRKQYGLNAVSLSGPGLEFLIQAGWWQKFTESFQISVMSLQPTSAGRQAELDGIFRRLAAAKKYEHFCADWGIQVNLSCPNGGLDPNDLISEAVPILEMAERVLPESISLVLKFGPEVHPRSMLRVANHPRCDAVCFCNTLPFGKQPRWAEKTPPVDFLVLLEVSRVLRSNHFYWSGYEQYGNLESISQLSLEEDCSLQTTRALPLTQVLMQSLQVRLPCLRRRRCDR